MTGKKCPQGTDKRFKSKTVCKKIPKKWKKSKEYLKSPHLYPYI